MPIDSLVRNNTIPTVFQISQGFGECSKRKDQIWCLCLSATVQYPQTTRGASQQSRTWHPLENGSFACRACINDHQPRKYAWSEIIQCEEEMEASTYLSKIPCNWSTSWTICCCWECRRWLRLRSINFWNVSKTKRLAPRWLSSLFRSRAAWVYTL